MNEISFNIADLITIICLVIVIIISLIIASRNKGKCNGCSYNNSCPFRKVDKNVK